jgi:hypothetical protein
VLYGIPESDSAEIALFLQAMIIEKDASADYTPSESIDPPPSYQDINPDSNLLKVNGEHQALRKASPGSSSFSGSQVQLPQASTTPKQKGKARSGGWFDGFGISRAAKEAKSAVYGRVRDVVEKPAEADSLMFLEACAGICDAHGLSFSSILQDPSIESHMPIYWAIIKLPSRDDLQLVTAILSYSAPLTQQTLSEIRLACLHVGDQALFQSLWRSPQLALAPSGSDQVLLGASATPDTVEVQTLPGDDGAFAAHFRIAKFEKRMKISKQISLEFIARGLCLQSFDIKCSFGSMVYFG